MTRTLLTLLLGLLFISPMQAQPKKAPSTALFGDTIHHWYLTHARGSVERYDDAEYLAIAENLLAYQNEDGGWPKNIDWLAKMDADSVRRTLTPYSERSTFDNRNTYPQFIYLAEVYHLTGEKRYRDAARRALEYILASQYPNGSWIGWEDEAIAYNDDIITGILNTWMDIFKGRPCFDWLTCRDLRRIRTSWERGLQLILDTQYIQQGVKTVWAQQHDQQTLQPVGARTYELPALTAQESATITLFLMSIDKPTAAIVEAVKAAVTWFEQNKILGKRIVTIPMPEGNPEDPAIKADRRMVDDPTAPPLWARFYELADNTVFLCNRDGIKVYSLDKVLPERRLGYSWYGTWGGAVLRAYPKWLKHIEGTEAK